MNKTNLVRNWHRKKISVFLGIILLLTLANSAMAEIPQSVTHVNNNSYATNYINWTWNEPNYKTTSLKISISIDGKHVKDLAGGIKFYRATGLLPNSKHTISIQTFDKSGRTNGKIVKNTRRTAPIAENSYPNPTNSSPNPIITSQILTKIQPYLISANRVNPNTPLYSSQDNNGPIYIYKLPTNPPVLVFQSSGAIDCDGQTTTQCNSNKDPWYQSQTSFEQSNGKPLDAANVPYYVLPEAGSNYFDFTKYGIKGGQLGLIIFGDKMNYGIFGDENGDPRSTGEISYALASSLGINPDPRNGGVSSGVTFIVFTGSGNVVSPIESHSQADSMGSVVLNTLLRQLS